MPNELKGKCDTLCIASKEDAYKIISLFEVIPNQDKQIVASKLLKYLHNNNETITIERSNILSAYCKDNKTIQIVDTNLFSNIDTINCVSDYLSTLCNNIFGEQNSSTYMMLKDIFNNETFDYDSSRGIYNISRFRRFLNQCNDINTLYIASNILLGYCNTKMLNYIDICKGSEANIHARFILNSQLCDIVECIYRDKTDFDLILKSINSYLEECQFIIPIEFELIRSMILMKNDKDIFKLLKNKKISNMFLIDASYDLPYISMWDLLDGTNVLNTLLHFKRKSERDVLSSDWENALPSDRYIFSYYEVISKSYYKWLYSSLDKLSNCDSEVFYNNLKRLKCSPIQENRVVDKTMVHGLKRKGIIKSFIRLAIGNRYILIGCFKKTAYIVTTMSDEKIVLIPIYNNNELELVDMLTTDSNIEKVRARVIQFNSEDNLHDYIPSSLITMEAFNISKIKLDQDANLSVIFDKKNTYMNKYNDIHTIIKQNLSNGNYKAMETDLCALYALIQLIEREVIYNTNTKVSIKEKADATKARMFAKNDFKHYHDELIKHDKKFNFSEVYMNSEISKNMESVFKLKINTIGITKFLKALKPF